MYFDIHTHILSGMDDGAKDISCSVEMLRMAAAENKNGVLFATPHFICGSIENKPERICRKIEELSEYAAEVGLNIRICPGCEVFLDPGVPSRLEKGEIASLNNGKYLLVELPMMSIPPYVDKVLYEIQTLGYTPIIAHPERNKEITHHNDILFDFISRGMLSQVNATSLKGLYGKKIYETALNLIKHNLVHFVASDAHTVRGRSTKLTSSYELIEKQFGVATAKRLFYTNGLAVFENGQVTAPEPIKINRYGDRIRKIVNPVIKLLSR